MYLPKSYIWDNWQLLQKCLNLNPPQSSNLQTTKTKIKTTRSTDVFISKVTFHAKNDEKLNCRKEKWFEFCFFIRILESVAPNVSSSTPLSRSKLNPTMSTSSHVITIQVTIPTRSSFYEHGIEKTWKAYSLWKLVYNLLNQGFPTWGTRPPGGRKKYKTSALLGTIVSVGGRNLFLGGR